jgi:predicted secreted hydrolase
MRSRWACLAAILLVTNANPQYRTALPGYRYEFPRDHFDHPNFQTEWWYYTGNVKTEDGHRFGFELTFFRRGTARDAGKTNAWDVRDIYLAHLALSDLDGGQFFHDERTNRAGPGIAGISQNDRRIWNGNWQIAWQGEAQKLQAIDERFELHLSMQSSKPPVIHGMNGISQKAQGPGRASHYVSLTRMITDGEIKMLGRQFQVSGTGWMDHEFFTNQLEPNQIGWDWMSIQLEDNTELMLFRIRRRDGSIDPYSSGTFVDANGVASQLLQSDFTLEPAGDVWTSPATLARYPVQWKISVAKLNLELHTVTSQPSQELTAVSKIAPSYWEGAIALAGHKGVATVRGVGYLEMTGYDHPVEALR